MDASEILRLYDLACEKAARNSRKIGSELREFPGPPPPGNVVQTGGISPPVRRGITFLRTAPLCVVSNIFLDGRSHFSLGWHSLPERTRAIFL